MAEDMKLRRQVVALLRGGHAHMPFEAAVADFPMEAINRKDPNVPYSPRALLEHIRLAQLDILEFITEPEYQEKSWPEDYWPEKDYQVSPEEWRATLSGIQEDMQSLLEMAEDPDVPLLQPFDHAPEYNLLRELLTVADHNAYHLGEFAILRQVMDTWGDR